MQSVYREQGKIGKQGSGKIHPFNPLWIDIHLTIDLEKNPAEVLGTRGFSRERRGACYTVKIPKLNISYLILGLSGTQFGVLGSDVLGSWSPVNRTCHSRDASSLEIRVYICQAAFNARHRKKSGHYQKI